MITEAKKNEIVTALNREKSLLGSMNKVAAKLSISSATISANILNPDNWVKVSENMWADLAGKLGVNLVDRVWNIVPTNNLKMIHQVLADAQNEGLFMAISEKAGSGKTAAIAQYAHNNTGVYVLQCEEWSRKAFLIRLATAVGITVGRYETAESMAEGIVKFFKQRAKECLPLIVLDEADKLRPSALRFIIPLYNRLEDEIGLVACGTDNLEKEVKKGVAAATKGYDEIDSRLGRSFVHLLGATKQDIEAICHANGVTDPAGIARIWKDSNPIHKQIGVKYMEIVTDLRAVKRKIKRERLSARHAA